MNSQENNVASYNPLADLISDSVYETLNSRGLINEKSVRDYQIKRQFKEMRDAKMSATNAIDKLRDAYPYLQFDTIRKIVYQIQK
ncbi:MAG: hypothetical protein ABFR62_09760 [Bacteroidota bacterium]